MSDILKSILGLVVDKARTAAASRLSDGDLTDEKLREVIVSEIDDIRLSLRGLSRQPLNSSLGFLKEGISRMGMAVRDASTRRQDVQAAITHAAEEFVAGASASTSQQTKQRSAGEALSLSNFEIVSQERWVCAKESFKMSREQATIAFGNTALSIEDRIMACKLRIASTILETFLDDPDAGAQDCLLYLRELHDSPAVRQTFTVHLDGGFKSRFNKTKRSEIVESVTAINHILSDFILNFTNMIHKVLSPRLEWPVIQLTDSKRPGRHTIVYTEAMRKQKEDLSEENQIKQMRKRWPNFEYSNNSISVYNFHKGQYPNAVNSAGCIYWDSPDLKYAYVDFDDVYVSVVSVDIGPNDDVYTLQRLLVSSGEFAGFNYLRLSVHDKKDKPVRVFSKGGLPPTDEFTYWVMRVLENKIVLCNNFGEVSVILAFVTEDQLNTKCSFSLPTVAGLRLEPPTRHATYMCATNKREVIIARSRGEEVYICPITDKGQMERIIQVPLAQHETESEVCGLAFDATHEEEIVVLRINRNQDSFGSENCHIEVYSRNGDLRNLYHLPGSWRDLKDLSHTYTYLLSNPKGIVAIVQYDQRNTSLIFWHLVDKVFIPSV